MRIWYSFFNDTATTEIYTLSRTRRSSDLVVRRLGIPDDYVERITELETAEVERRLRHFRGERPQPEVRGRTVILADDGLATGVTARAAVRALRRLEPRRLVLAAPVCAAQSSELLGPEVDELVCLEAPPDLGAIGFWYRDFSQTRSEERRVGKECRSRWSPYH